MSIMSLWNNINSVKKKKKGSSHFREGFVKLQCFCILHLKCVKCAFFWDSLRSNQDENRTWVSVTPLFTRGCWCAKIDPAKRKCFSEEWGLECDFYREIPDCHCCLRSDMLVVLTTLSSLKLLRLALQDNYINIREEVSDNSREGSYHFALSGKSFQVISQHFSSLLPKVSSKRLPVS